MPRILIWSGIMLSVITTFYLKILYITNTTKFTHQLHHFLYGDELSTDLEPWIFLSLLSLIVIVLGFPGGSDGKASARSEGDLGSIPGLGRSPGEGNGNPLQYSCLEIPMDGGAWQATVHGVSKSQT